MAAHTPGPWFVDNDAFVYALNDRNTNIFWAHAQPGSKTAEDGEFFRTPQTEVEANARLIAKSPEMLDALEEAEQVFRTLALEGPSATALELADRYAALLAAIRGTD